LSLFYCELMLRLHVILLFRKNVPLFHYYSHASHATLFSSILYKFVQFVIFYVFNLFFTVYLHNISEKIY
jgi:hypothetical protein